jgi:2,4-diaminopentanoate dehydrogenase
LLIDGKSQLARQKPYRVVQWATGKVGRVAIRHFVSNPAFELAAVLVTNPKKVGKDAGELAGIAPCGVLATDDVDAILAMDADCVHFSPLKQDIDMVCRLLRAGKNAVSAIGPWNRTERYRGELEQLEAACRAGGTSFHGAGIRPGFIGDLVPLTLTRLMNRVDCIRLSEVIDHLANPSKWIEYMGFGRTPEDVRNNPGRPPDAHLIFAPSMETLVEALGKKLEKVTAEIKLSTAQRDIEYGLGVIRAGIVAGQEYVWTAWAEGKPLVVYHCFWKMGYQDVEPKLDCGASGYRVVFEGDPAMELTLTGLAERNGDRMFLAIPWTAMADVTAIPDVVDAPPGVLTHYDLGLVRPRGLVRS